MRTDREMSNLISKVLAKYQAEVPEYTPYIIPGPAKKPRAQQTQDRTSASVNWRKFSRQGKRSNLHQQLPIQSRRLYSVRFLFAADFCRAFEGFGALAAHLDHLLGDRLIDRGIRFCSDQLRSGSQSKITGGIDYEIPTHLCSTARYHLNCSNTILNRSMKSDFRITGLARRRESHTGGGKIKIIK